MSSHLKIFTLAALLAMAIASETFSMPTETSPMPEQEIPDEETALMECQENNLYKFKTYLLDTQYHPFWHPGGSGYRVAVHPVGEVTVIGTDWRVYHLSGIWRLVGNIYANDLAYGANGKLYISGAGATGKHGGVFWWTGTYWAHQYTGVQGNIAVTPEGSPYMTQSGGQTWHERSTGWKYLGINGDLAIGSTGQMYSLAESFDSTGNQNIFKWSGDSRVQIPGGATRIEVDNVNQPWVVNSAGYLYRKTKGGWETRNYNMRVWDIGIGAKGNLWLVQKDTGHVYHHQESRNDGETGLTNLYSCY
mmetsp:Transcript_58752/g.66967  ORF Transcript_58752/g.66967 Transcript_58752/m.66967 type:complete len:305 (-) Transcript_58752:54-968(-)